MDPKSTALLVIDAIEADDDADYEPDPAWRAYRDNVARCVDLAHGAGMPVIFCNDAHIPGVDAELELWGDHGIRGRMRVYPEIDVREADFTIPKRRYSSFYGTDLDLLLRELGVEELIAVGCDANICVLHTLADAFNRNYRTVVPADATLTFLCGTQEGAVEHFTRCFGTRMTTVDELAAELGE